MQILMLFLAVVQVCSSGSITYSNLLLLDLDGMIPDFHQMLQLFSSKLSLFEILIWGGIWGKRGVSE